MATEEQEKAYLEGGGYHCLYCGDGDIEGGFIQINAGIAWQTIKCNACGAGWDDVYDLARVDTCYHEGGR